jgi:hypothetical protein
VIPVKYFKEYSGSNVNIYSKQGVKGNFGFLPFYLSFSPSRTVKEMSIEQKIIGLHE